MKKLFLSLATVVLTTTALFAQKKAADVAKFDSESIDLGKIKQDIPATATFTVTNISSEPLIIEQANPTCGCTISDYTKEPIAPGKTGTIKATYNAKNLNAFEKHLTVKFAGIDEVKSITLKGEVLTADDYAKIAPAADTKKVEEKTMTTTTTPAKTAGKRTTTVKKSSSKSTTLVTAPKS